MRFFMYICSMLHLFCFILSFSFLLSACSANRSQPIDSLPLSNLVPAGAKRVAYAETQRGAKMRELLAKQGESERSGYHLLLLASKQDKILQLYVAPRNSPKKYKLLAEYPICAASGDLGTKRREGDGQVPEGIYRLNHLNPESRFFLSLGINYPNAQDVERAKKEGQTAPLGGEIYVHGDCLSIGCLAMGDEAIMEIYLLALWGQRIQPVQAVFLPSLRIDEQDFRAELLKEYPKERENWTRLAAWLAEFRANLR